MAPIGKPKQRDARNRIFDNKSAMQNISWFETGPFIFATNIVAPVRVILAWSLSMVARARHHGDTPRIQDRERMRNAAARLCYSLEPSVGKQTAGTHVCGYVINVEASRNHLDISWGEVCTSFPTGNTRSSRTLYTFIDRLPPVRSTIDTGRKHDRIWLS